MLSEDDKEDITEILTEVTEILNNLLDDYQMTTKVINYINIALNNLGKVEGSLT